MKKFLLGAMLVVCPTQVFAQSNDCNALLNHGINNITRYKSAEHTIAYKWYSNCGMNFESASDSSIMQASASIFEIAGGDAIQNSSQQKQKIQTWCKENETFAKNNKSLYEEAKTISEPALKAWSQCQEMANKGVFISVNPSGDNSDFVHFEIDSKSDGDLRLYENTTSNYQCTTLLSEKQGENKGILKAFKPKDQPLIRNANIHINCIRQAPKVSNTDGIVKTKYEQAYVSIQTSGPSFQFYAPEVVNDYIATPSGSVIAFSRNSCPSGWSEYKEAYGRFIRGLDKSGQDIDPDSKRKLASLQDDALKTHNHSATDPGHSHGMGPFSQIGNIYASGGGRSAWGWYSSPNQNVTTSMTGITISNFGDKETRPKNVSLLYCIKN